MEKIRAIISLMKTPRLLIDAFLTKMAFLFKSDELFLKLRFYFSMGFRLNLNNPQTYSEKLQWLKLYNRKNEYTMMVDKVRVKSWVASMIGEQYVIPTIKVYHNPEEVDFAELPDKFVLKCNHNSRVGLYICKDKKMINENKIRKELEKGLKDNHFLKTREWPYKNVERLILAEEYLEEEGKSSPNDYKVMCFDGKAKIIQFHSGRFSEDHRQDFYDRNWNITQITQGAYGKVSDKPAPKPVNLDEMLKLSEILAKDMPHCRVDWYDVKGHLYFGEMTFFDSAGFCPYDKIESELLMGSWISLPHVETQKIKDLGIQGIDMFY